MAAVFVVAWSSGFVGATLAEGTTTTPAGLLAWRYLVTAAVLVAVCVAVPSTRRALLGTSRREVGQQAVLGLLAHVVFLGGVFLAAGRGLDAGISALVCSLQPMLVGLAGRLWFGDRLRPRQVAGLVLGLAGVALGVGGVGEGAAGAVWLVVASLVALCASALLERRWEPATPVLTGLTIQVVVAAGVFTAAALAGGGMAVRADAAFAVAVAWLVLLSGIGGYAAFIWCLRRLGATPTSTLLYLTPAVTMLWAWAMFAQRPTPQQWVGLVIVLVGVALTLMPTGRRTARERPRH